jgi:hypothetical protein
MSLSLDKKTIEDFDKKLISDLRKSLDAAGTTASGKTKESLNSVISLGSYKLFGRAFIYGLEYGRKKTTGGGNGSLKGIILKWINDKGIIPRDNIKKETLAFLIARKIHRQGDLLHRTGTNFRGMNKPTGIINSVINDGRIKELSKRLILDFVKSAKTEIYGNGNII